MEKLQGQLEEQTRKSQNLKKLEQNFRQYQQDMEKHLVAREQQHRQDVASLLTKLELSKRNNQDLVTQVREVQAHAFDNLNGEEAHAWRSKMVRLLCLPSEDHTEGESKQTTEGYRAKRILLCRGLANNSSLALQGAYSRASVRARTFNSRSVAWKQSYSFRVRFHAASGRAAPDYRSLPTQRWAEWVSPLTITL